MLAELGHAVAEGEGWGGEGGVGDYNLTVCAGRKYGDLLG